MSEVEREDIRIKLKFFFRYIILTAFFYWLALTVLFEVWSSWQIFFVDKVFWSHWELGLEMVLLFFLFYLIDKDSLWFRTNWVHKFGMTFFFSWFLADFFSFLEFVASL